MYPTQSNALISLHGAQEILINVIEMDSGFHDEPHQHSWHQILYPLQGLVKTQTDTHQFYIPHHRALFIPAGVRHESWVAQKTCFMGIYLNPAYKARTPKACRTIEVSSFFRELILLLERSIVREGEQDETVNRLIKVLYDQVWCEREITLEIPIPRDRRLAPIVDALLARPSLTMTLADWSVRVGASERTLSRLFKKELGLSYPHWRQRLRLMVSLSLLVQDNKVEMVAHEVGYQSVSAFIDAFKRAFRLTPQQYKLNGSELDFSFEKWTVINAGK